MNSRKLTTTPSNRARISCSNVCAARPIQITRAASTCGYWDKYDINTHEDTTIPTDGIRAQMNEWLADPDLAALSRACADCSQRVLDYQLNVPEFRTFIDTGHFPKTNDD